MENEEIKNQTVDTFYNVCNTIENVDIKRYTLEQNIEHNNLLTSVYSFEYALLRGDLIKLIL